MHGRMIGYGIVLLVLTLVPIAEGRERWSEKQAAAWGKKIPWLVGANYTPATAINQLEMWQADTFDPKQIDRELGWAASLGFNSMRVFLHHLLWEQDSQGLLDRMEQFLKIAERHKIGVMFVLFDSCWDPNPKLGKQRAPSKGVHNSGWVQSPGSADLQDEKRHKLLQKYVEGVIGRFKDDPRVQVWDVWNEPDNTNDKSYGKDHLKQELPNKHALTLRLLKLAMGWARAANPSQPITSGVWLSGHKAHPKQLNPFEVVQITESDIITFHAYDPLPGVKAWLAHLKMYDRPILCTEFMARPNGSRFDPILGYLKEQKVGAYCWGFVAGKTNTIFAWDTWQRPEKAAEPKVWFHDILRKDGTAFAEAEVAYIRRITGAKQSAPEAPR
ncbi:MAG: cellulase family glycosylhydrolase [Gemmataceae bacterium]